MRSISGRLNASDYIRFGISCANRALGNEVDCSSNLTKLFTMVGGL